MDPNFIPRKPVVDITAPSTPSPQQQESTTPLPAPGGVTSAPVTKTKHRRKLLLSIVGVAFLLLGGSAAAYFGVIVPNKPENILKKAISNLSNQSTFSLKGDISAGATAGSAASLDVNIKMLHVDPAQKTMLLDTDVTAGGVKVPLEARYVGDSAYVKLGDLSSLKTLLAASGGSAEVTALVDAIDSKVSNQWIEIDKTLLGSADADCSINGLFTTFNKDTAAASDKLLADSQYKFFTVKSSTKDTVDDQATTKFELTIDKAKLLAYGNKLKDTAGYKALADCAGNQQSQASSATQTAQNTTIDTFNVWVDGSKHIKRVQLAIATTDAGESIRTTIDFTFLDQTVTVDKPANAKPVTRLFSELAPLLKTKDSPLPGVNALSGSLSL